MSFLAPAIPAIAGSAASAGVSFGLNRFFGGDSGGSPALQTFAPTGISAGGLESSIGGSGNIAINSTAERRANVGGVANTFGQQASALAELMPKVVPGFSDLRRVRETAIENARRNSIGNLRENLARRRVLGSNFAQDAIARAEAEFAAMQERSAAESLMQELEASVSLINQQFTAQRGQFQTFLDEMNLEANLAAGLAGKATDAISKTLQTQAQLDFLEQKGRGSFATTLTKPIGDAFGNFISGLKFGGGAVAGDPMAG